MESDEAMGAQKSRPKLGERDIGRQFRLPERPRAHMDIEHQFRLPAPERPRAHGFLHRLATEVVDEVFTIPFTCHTSENPIPLHFVYPNV